MKGWAAPLLGAALIGLALFGAVRSPIPRSPALARARLLEDVLKAKNDNDPRLDSGFENLTPEEKRVFRTLYSKIPREGRNERGTVVYLLGRNLKQPEDWTFLREVVSEPPCLGLQDCSRPGAGDEVTLAYPALVALRQARAGGDIAELERVLAAARSSGVPAVARAAR
ncbi:MAG: hypothetical protein HY925_12595 [Elusimicrobia bacterium]|nr:hypothetical protein [Elusimicrobiota bacterium]